MFEYLVTTTDGYTTKVITDGDPTRHPTFAGRVLDVETIRQIEKPKVVLDIEKRFERID